MKRRTIIRFEGGPRAGEQYVKTRPARLSTYLNGDGEHVRTQVGDRIVSARTEGRGVYVHRHFVLDEDENRIHTYEYVGN